MTRHFIPSCQSRADGEIPAIVLNRPEMSGRRAVVTNLQLYLAEEREMRWRARVERVGAECDASCFVKCVPRHEQAGEQLERLVIPLRPLFNRFTNKALGP